MLKQKIRQLEKELRKTETRLPVPIMGLIIHDGNTEEDCTRHLEVLRNNPGHERPLGYEKYFKSKIDL